MSEAYRKALEAGDHIAAARAIQDAVSGDYDSNAVSGLHTVARMTSAERAVDPEPRTSGTSVVQVNNTFVGQYRNGSGS